MKRQESTLALPCALAYTLLVIYASLHPFTGWRTNGVDVFDFLFATWPRYFTLFDLVANVAAYALLGYLWNVVLHARLPRTLTVLAAFLLGACLSLCMESLQNFLPTRVASNLDLACNSLGALLGSLAGLRWGVLLHDGGRLAHWRHTHLIAPPRGDYGIILACFWLLTLLNPGNLLFAGGGLRHLLDIPPPLPFAVEGFARIETVIAALGALAAGLVFSLVQRRPAWWWLLCLFALALSLRALAAALLIEPAHFIRWVTLGNMLGLGIAMLLLLPLLRLQPDLRRALAAMSLLALTALVNLAPENPYLLQAALEWYPGQLLNFNGLTRFASILWPFLALAYLMLPHREQEQR